MAVQSMNQAQQALLWSLPQPIFVFGFAILAAYAVVYQWIDIGVLVAIAFFLPIVLVLLLERLIPKREDSLLNWRDLAEDTFWVLTIFFIWVPIFDEHYDTPVSNLFFYLRETSGFPFRLEANSVAGLMGMAMLGVFAIEFIGYWAHRLQHRFLLLWRMHATHHHISKMSIARADRTHPLELIGLNLGSIVVLAFLGAGDGVIAVILVFRIVTGHINHANLPLTSGVFGWLFNTPQWHLVHHSCVMDESNTNYGCTVIIWDRLFGTFSGKESIERVGSGTGEQLSLWTQLTIPFRSNEVLKNL
jgi:sterol desaturase/sphingolipid hydroxylase (fatty acid hydroxylase superfamily)